jgi:small subunit ribosomal protein S8
MSIDSIGDFLTIIRNGIRAGKREVQAPYSRLKHEIATVLYDEGFIRDVVEIAEENNKKTLKIGLKYVQGESVIHEIDRISKPGLRMYQAHKMFRPVIGNLGISIITTNRGVMSNKKARSLGVGGEVLCSVW